MKKRVREQHSDDEIEEFETRKDRTRRQAEIDRQAEADWRKWVVLRLNAAEHRAERIEAEVRKIAPMLGAIYELLKVPDESESEEEDKGGEQADETMVESTLRDTEAATETEKTAEKTGDAAEDDVEMAE
jgi:Pyruvate/2-oxoacid:ferredoxin oxidoreductase gamma subunit